MRLAANCGIRVAETQIIGVGPRRAVIVRRFDRTPQPFGPSCHYLSGLSALDLVETSDAGSYMDLAGFLHRQGSDQVADRPELFRRMVFNVLCGNRDDHLKNHAFVRGQDGGLRLSPAFDIVPQPDMDPLQAIEVGRSVDTRPSRTASPKQGTSTLAPMPLRRRPPPSRPQCGPGGGSSRPGASLTAPSRESDGPSQRNSAKGRRTASCVSDRGRSPRPFAWRTSQARTDVGRWPRSRATAEVGTYA